MAATSSQAKPMSPGFSRRMENPSVNRRTRRGVMDRGKSTSTKSMAVQLRLRDRVRGLDMPANIVDHARCGSGSILGRLRRIGPCLASSLPFIVPAFGLTCGICLRRSALKAPEPPERKSRGCSHVPPEWVGNDATFFITINCQPRGVDHLTNGDQPRRIFESVAYLHDKRMWFPEMMLLMPDHLHALISFPWEERQGMNRVIANWKRFVATKHGVRWQRDYFDHRIRSEQDHQSAWYYIRENPVRAGLVRSFDEWPHVWRPTGIGW